MDRAEALRRLREARVGRLATVDTGGLPHVVPFVFAVDGETIYSAVDAKPKRSRELRRLDNIRANPNVQLVVDHYEEAWDRLWWVRAGGPARMVTDDEEFDRAVELLAAKYAQYGEEPPPGPVIAITIAHLRWWEGGGA
jgi:PPOX class probable F420-dependent enzyme